MKKILIIILGLIFNYSFSQNLTDSENYIYKKTYLSDPTDIVQKQLESVQYLDGLGRVKQVISVKSSPSGKDMVIPVVYDQFGRKTKDYLPVPAATTNSGLQASVTEGTVNSYYGVTNAFSDKELEPSPLSRVFQSAMPGEEWKMNAGHTVKYSYDSNSTIDKVKKYQVTTTWDNANQIYNSALTLTPIAFYDENTLYKFSVKDEDNNEKIVFKDLYGHIILVRKNDGTNNIDTYYVYDSNDHLAYVIPPLASVSVSLTATIIDQLCYQYRYDNKKRLVEKKLPGKGLEYFIYDKQSRLVLTQDGVLRTVNNNFGKRGWLFTKYDQFGRSVYNGFFANTATRIQVQTAVNAIPQWNNEKRSSTSFTLNGMGVYYTKAAYPTTGDMTILGVNYYDTYPPLPTGVSIPLYIITPGQSVLTQDAQGSSKSTKSLPTAFYAKNIENDNWTRDFIWYDTKGRVIGSHSVNHLSGYTKKEMELDFSGTPKKVNTYHIRQTGDTEIKIKERFVYDNQNRLLKQFHQVDDDQEELLAENSYNEIGELINKKVGNSTSTSALQSIDYTYNIRGWMTSINNPNNPTSFAGKLFGLELKYNNPGNPAITTAKYNGNISELDWKTSNGNILKRYSYKYDKLERLRDATYNEPFVAIPPTNGYGESLTYDVNGNIKTLKRFQPNGNTPLLIDDLVYSVYKGNQLIKVTDNNNNPSGYPTGGNTIDYDPNGNMLNHVDKGIYGISYNYLDLPNKVKFTQDSSGLFETGLSFVYRSDGVKLKKYFNYINPRSGSMMEETTDYLDGFQYLEERGFRNLQFIPTSEGYYDFKNKRYVYNYTDQVGNVRLAYYRGSNNQAIIDKETNYYPFGLEYIGFNGTNTQTPSYAYGFQGQEKQKETGWNSFKWRNAIPELGRFFNADPLSEEYAYQSTYSFSENRVIDAREMEGLESDPIHKDSNTYGASYNGLSYDGGVSSLMKDNNGGTIGANIQSIDLGTFKTNNSFTSGVGNGFVDTFKGIGNFLSDPVSGVSNAVGNYTWKDFGNSTINGLTMGVYGQVNGLVDFGSNLYNGNYYEVGHQTGEAAAGAVIALATEGAGKGIGKLAGSGPVAGVLEVSNRVKSIAQFKNYFPKGGIEFVFDTEANIFVVGKPKGRLYGSPHESLAVSIEAGSAGNSKYVGGIFNRKGNTIFTNEFSGHYGTNWTNQNRTQFVKFMEDKTGLKVNHVKWE
ncbi:DUF6443 domain-containing protein [Chryseobacterium daecheongense]|nr:DUF6443 domain-containing protein [Chryseobacterium daecheongense]